MSEAVNVDLLGLYNSALAEIKAIDDKLNGLKGTIAQVQKDAAEAVLDAPVDLAVVTYFESNKAYTATLAALGATKNRTLADYVLGFRDYVADLDEFIKHSAKDWISAHHAGMDDGAGLRSRRAELVNIATAYFVVIGQTMKDVEITPIPDAPKNTSAGRSASGGAKVSGITFYRVVDGIRKDWGPEYDLSRVAFRLGHCGIANLKAALSAAGWDGNLTTDQEFSVTVKTDKGDDMTATIGWSVAQSASTDSTEVTSGEVTDDSTDEVSGDKDAQ